MMLHKLLNTDVHDSAEDALFSIRESMVHSQKISAWTHNLYKYPACFPATFPRAVINSFSKPDDWILDPFVGGGTSAVEALVARRNFVGTDINDLAIFSSKLKSMVLTSGEIKQLDRWTTEFTLNKVSPEFRRNDDLFFKNVPSLIENSTRKISSAINSLPTKRLQHFAKGALLRLGQLEIEQRLTITNLADAEKVYKETLRLNLNQASQLHFEIERGTASLIPSCNIEIGSATELEVTEVWAKNGKQFSLVVTSPPYPERHILYNKWQVNGRSETRLPYWIIGSNQVESEPYYTMAGRENPASLEIYITKMLMVFENLNTVMEKNGVCVQVLAFSDLARQLPLYLAAMNEAGFEEIRNIDTNSHDGRLWRDVPNRRWFNRIDSNQSRCKEVVLFHRKLRNI